MSMKIDSLKLKITSLHSIPFVVVLALAAYPLAGLGHGKGLYSTEAEAQARADDIGCMTSIKTMGNGCLVWMNENCTNNYASNETWSPDPAKSTTHSQVVGAARCSTAFAYREHRLAL